MRRNQVISKRKLISNIVGWPDYYISKRSRLYRYYPKRKVWMLLKGTLNRRRKAQYYEKRYVKYCCNICGKKRYENNKPV